MNELVMNGAKRKRRPRIGDVLTLERDTEDRPVEATVFAQFVAEDSNRLHIAAVFEPVPHVMAESVGVADLRLAHFAFTDLGLGIRQGAARIVGSHALLVRPPTVFRSCAGFAKDRTGVTHWTVWPPRRVVPSGELTAEDAQATIRAHTGVEFAATLALQGWRPEHAVHNHMRIDESRRRQRANARGTLAPPTDSRSVGVALSSGASSTVAPHTGDRSLDSGKPATRTDAVGHLPAEEFWQLLGHVDRAKLDAGLEEEALEELTRQLSQLPKSKLIDFEDQLAARLHALDTRAHFEASFDGGGGPDSFLYQRCYVVARGREYYDRVLADPGQMPDSEEHWCETLLYTASAAWRLKSGGDDWGHVPEISYETGSNASGW